MMLPLRDETIKKIEQLGGEFKKTNYYSQFLTNQTRLQTILYFPNGFGASVIKISDPEQYRFSAYRQLVGLKSSEDYWEIAVLDKNGEIDYDNPVAQGDTIRGLTDDEVVTCCEAISSLKKRNN